ncbi:hypothetical protein E4U43_007076 [Claviceps pusilla]|uniref:Uncharacterized protein n=1 Tax=Claviceps pusilla TaxID=123648 RepID=A0A9P7T0V4_9HYPO|nr:hypothetical protein E4U43_007076 [Claviceps pusilla]
MTDIIMQASIFHISFPIGPKSSSPQVSRESDLLIESSTGLEGDGCGGLALLDAMHPFDNPTFMFGTCHICLYMIPV